MFNIQDAGNLRSSFSRRDHNIGFRQSSWSCSSTALLSSLLRISVSDEARNIDVKQFAVVVTAVQY